jgi:hypothetical protein
MSYHILHQFDEQWIAELTRDDEKSKELSSRVIADAELKTGRSANLSAREINRWIVAIAILIAAFAMLFALDANQRADTLQQRLDTMEKQVGRIKSKAEG